MLIAKRLSHCSSVTSMTGWFMASSPALATTMSRLPKVSIAVANMTVQVRQGGCVGAHDDRPTSGRFDIRHRALGVVLVGRVVDGDARSEEAYRCAMALPIPRAEPVTTATFPVISIIFRFLP